MSSTENQRPVRRALVSVYDKTGLTELADRAARRRRRDRLHRLDRRHDRRHRRPGDPRRGAHRLPRVPRRARQDAAPAGARRACWPTPGCPEHLAQLDELGIAPFELVVVNLYPFTATVASGAGPDECVEQIDIGGPSMVRAAAKNHPSVAVVVDPARYAEVVAAVEAGGFTLAARRLLAADAFAHTAAYDAAVASWFAADYAPDEEAADSGFPAFTGTTWVRGEVLRYGENPHQQAALYLTPDGAAGRGLAGARAAARQGDELQQLRRRRRRLAGRARPRPTPPSRSSSTPTRAASRWAPTWPTPTRRRTRATRSPRSAASSPPTAPSRPPPRSRSRRCSPRSSSPPASSPRRSRSSRARRTSGSCR